MNTPEEILNIMKAINDHDYDTIWYSDSETVFERLWWLYGAVGGDENFLRKVFPENA